MILRWWLEIENIIILTFIFIQLARAKEASKCKTASTTEIFFKKSKIPLPELLGSTIYALVRPKIPPKTSEERIAFDYQHDALDRLIRCRLNNTKCFKFKKPKPRIDFGKFCWTAQKFEPLRAAISQVRCKAPSNPHDATVSTYWKSLLDIYNKTSVEVEISVSNFFLAQTHSLYTTSPSVNWFDIISGPFNKLPVLIGQMNIGGLQYDNSDNRRSDSTSGLGFSASGKGRTGTFVGFSSGNNLNFSRKRDTGLGFGSGSSSGLGFGSGSSSGLGFGSGSGSGLAFHHANTVGIRFGGIDPLDPMFPLNPLNPYSPLNPFIHLPATSLNSPLNTNGPFFPLNPDSPFSPFNPANPFNVLSPILVLPPTDPMSPWNPSSPYFPTSDISPYNVNNKFSPLNPFFKLDGPPYGSPFAPLNGNFLINRNSPWYPLGPLAQLSLLPDSDFKSPINPQSPFNPMNAWNPQSPLEGLKTNDFLNPLNLKDHPYNLINGEEIKRSLSKSSPAYISNSPRQGQHDPFSNIIPHDQSKENQYQRNNRRYHRKTKNRNRPEYDPILNTYPLNPHPVNHNKFGFNPPMAPESLYNRPKRAVGRWYYRFRPEAEKIPSVNPCDPRSPYFAGNAYSPYHPLHPSNPYSILNPLNTLLITDPRSPYNPRSSIFAGNPESPYNPAHPMNPFNPESFVFTCKQTGSLHPNNPRSPFYILDPRSPYNSMNPFSPYNSNHALLSGLPDSHALNPALRTSPFHPSQIGSPYNPKNYRKLNANYKLNNLNDLNVRITSKTAPEPHLGWHNGVKEDFSFIPPTPPEPGSKLEDQLVPYTAPEIPLFCPPAPPAPPPPQPPYYPGYYRWESSWPAPVYIQTSNVLTNEPVPLDQWKNIWERLWKMKCKRESDMANLKSPLGNQLAIMDLPSNVII